MAEVLVAEIRSDSQPWSGRRDRSSKNFSLAGVPEGTQELLWRTEPDSGAIRFSVMSDVRANYDQRVLSNIASGSRTRLPRERESLSRRGFYIANPFGATEDGFLVKVYALVP
ncbi:hypothetical protein [Nocardia mexicana]|uniref:Uncharacterized protein n=1 Tax=Nocardia mexicana TaxID=279262 RepID=A0A370H2D3_9NOCA|nr:hypothetical protein [Nocardia mexicana]RDI50170.1 hypothetical protein DFR68_106609 [Nocardia mexicana]